MLFNVCSGQRLHPGGALHREAAVKGEWWGGGGGRGYPPPKCLMRQHLRHQHSAHALMYLAVFCFFLFMNMEHFELLNIFIGQRNSTWRKTSFSTNA